MNQKAHKREQLSALVDGELQSHELTDALDYAGSDAGQADWQMYQLIGDALRQSHAAALPLAAPSAQDAAGGQVVSPMLMRLRQQLEQEPGRQTLVAAPQLAQIAPAAESASASSGAVSSQAANASVWRWRVAAGLASVVAVGALTWNLALGDSARGVGGGQQLAQEGKTAPVVVLAASQQPSSVQSAPSEQLAGGQESESGEAVMLRDPRLDALMAAHRQYGNTTALQMPARFLRNANFGGNSQR